jgi:hypothetical protein
MQQKPIEKIISVEMIEVFHKPFGPDVFSSIKYL